MLLRTPPGVSPDKMEDGLSGMPYLHTNRVIPKSLRTFFSAAGSGACPAPDSVLIVRPTGCPNPAMATAEAAPMDLRDSVGTGVLPPSGGIGAAQDAAWR